MFEGTAGGPPLLAVIMFAPRLSPVCRLKGIQRQKCNIIFIIMLHDAVYIT